MSQDSETLLQIVQEYIREQRRAQKWERIFRLLKFVLVVFFLLVLFGSFGDGQKMEMPVGRHVALIDIEGVIDASEAASADNIVSALRTAMEGKHVVAVLLRINSPGGSPVQAGYVYDEVKRLQAIYPEKKVYAVITDVGASAAYYIAAAADAIYADRASMVGSIGVTMNPYGLASFGFTEAMKKLGVERRTLTAGESKDMLDPFSPRRAEDVAHFRSLLGEVHRQFIERVKAGRGQRLKNDKQLFTGLVWTGERSLDLGLVDGLGSSGHVLREVIGEETVFDYTLRPSYFEQLAEQLGVTMARTLVKLSSESGVQLR